MTPKKLRAFRERLGLSLTEMAGALGVDRQTWHRWEQGTRPIPVYLWRALEHLKHERRNNELDSPKDAQGRLDKSAHPKGQRA